VISKIHLTLLVGRTIPIPALAEVVQALQSVQVTVSSGQRSGFQLGFALSKRSLLVTTLIPAGYFDPGMRVIVIATVNGFPNVLMDGIITRQEVVPSNEIGQSTLTVTGEDLSVLMSLSEKKLLFPAMPAVARVALLLAQYAVYGLVPLVIPEMIPDIASPTSSIPTEKGTDLNYIESLAKEHGYVFYIDPGPAPGMNIAYWGPDIRIGIPQPALNVNMDAHTNVESLSFSFDGLARVQPVINIQEPFTKLSIPIPIPEINPLRPPLALKPAPSLRTEPLKDVAKLTPLKAAAKAIASSAESSDAVSGSGQLDVLRYGRILKARGLVGVRGAGMAYDGLYYVKSVTHNIKAGEYKQSFSLARNGLVSLTPAVVP
jgi:hypothetical protein